MENLPKEKEQIVYYQEDEIDLYELWLTLKKRWKVIAGSTVFFVLFAVAYIFISTPLYKVKTYIKVMYINDKPVKKPEQITALIKAKFDSKKKELKEKGYYLDNIEISKIKNEKTDIILLTTMGTSNENAVKQAEIIINFLNTEYSPILNRFLQKTKNQIKTIKEEIKLIKSYRIKELERRKNFLLQEEIPLLKNKIKFLSEKVNKLEKLILNYRDSINNYETAIKNLTKSMNNPQLSDSSLLILSNQIVQYENIIASLQSKIKNYEIEINNIQKEKIPAIEKRIKQINEIDINKINKEIEKLYVNLGQLERKIKTLKISLNPPITEEFKVINQIIKDSPTKPKKALILAVASVSGLFLGIFLAFFLEWMENARKRYS
ncbi:Wzz/FepE/Etk N-terminal domain-containing protein [Persephonella sp.]